MLAPPVNERTSRGRTNERQERTTRMRKRAWPSTPPTTTTSPPPPPQPSPLVLLVSPCILAEQAGEAASTRAARRKWHRLRARNPLQLACRVFAPLSSRAACSSVFCETPAVSPKACAATFRFCFAACHGAMAGAATKSLSCLPSALR